jgi:hypothetical protein
MKFEAYVSGMSGEVNLAGAEPRVIPVFQFEADQPQGRRSVGGNPAASRGQS